MVLYFSSGTSFSSTFSDVCEVCICFSALVLSSVSFVRSRDSRVVIPRTASGADIGVSPRIATEMRPSATALPNRNRSMFKCWTK